MRDRLVIAIEHANNSSHAWSRDAVASRLLFVAVEKPSAFANASRSIDSGVPASAPLPSGQRSMRRNASWMRSRSRASDSTCASAQWPIEIG